MSARPVTLHVRLSQETAELLVTRATAERRPLASLLALILEDAVRPVVYPGRSTLTPLVEQCVTTDEPGKAGGKR